MKLWLSEYCSLVTLPNHAGQAPIEPALNEQLLDFTSGVATSNSFQPLTRIVRLNADAPCSLLISADPVASTQNGRLAADRTEFRGVPEGQGFKLSVISNT
jgi:hypothetical protein